MNKNTNSQMDNTANSSLKNVLENINLSGIMFNAGKDNLSKEYCKETTDNMLNLLKSYGLHEECIRMIIALIKDERAEDEHICFLSNILDKHLPYSKWGELQEIMLGIPDTTYLLFNKNCLLKIAAVLEEQYARGITCHKALLGKLYNIICSDNYILGFISPNEVRLKCAKKAYNCNEYNVEGCIKKIKKLIKKLHKNNEDNLEYIAEYYLGLCILERASGTIDAQQYINNSAKDGFNLAKKFIKHCRIHFETSKGY